MKMGKNEYTRRDFLKSAAWGITAIAVHSSVSTAGEPSKRTFKQAVKQINAINPDFVFVCGDLVNTVNEKSFADFKKIKADLIVPCYCVSGNHDVGNKPTRESLQYYRKIIGEDYYSFEHKGYVFVIVNTQLWKAPVKDESKKHDSWLEATLETAANKRARIFVVGHYPLFLKQPDEAEKYMNLPLAKRKELLSLFEKRGVVAALGGHTHRLIINDYKSIQLVNGETTSKNFDKRPFGFRIWHVMDPRPFKHDFVSLEGF